MELLGNGNLDGVGLQFGPAASSSSGAGCFKACFAHELRNEIVEELIADRVSESCAEQDAPLVRGGRTRGTESEKSRR